MVGDNACELELPEAMKIHPVVNVSQVKKYHGSLQRPPPIEIDGEEEYEVEDILDHSVRLCIALLLLFRACRIR